ncbi:MAG: ice-binding family protein [Rectinemataceae bacterium]|nr:ice-binding family protein [Rectinemataceae bacterium]
MKRVWYIPILLAALFFVGCGNPVNNDDVLAPTVISSLPADGTIDVARNRNVTATFSEAMDAATVDVASFSLAQGLTPVPAMVSYEGLVATLDPADDLAINTTYTATITVDVTDSAGNAMESAYVWSFTTGVNTAAGPSPVDLGTAKDYAALAKSGISTTGTTAITGDIGVSPAAATYITGFSLSLDATNVFSISSYVTGSVYAADYAVPTPANLTTAIGDMETAYTDAAGRTLPDGTELYAGDLSGQTIPAGLYKWGTGVLINGSVTLSGGANDVWIFQIAQDLSVGNGAMVTLSGGALAKNVFWQVAGQTTLGTTSDFKGIVLCKTLIEVSTGSMINGRLLAQTAITLDAVALTEPAM